MEIELPFFAYWSVNQLWKLRCNQILDWPNWYAALLLPKMSRKYVGARHIFPTNLNEQQTVWQQPKKIEMQHDPTLSLNQVCKDLLLWFMHKAAYKHGTPLILSISFDSQKMIGFITSNRMWYGRSWPWRAYVGGEWVAPEKKNTFSRSNYNWVNCVLGIRRDIPLLHQFACTM